MSKILIVTAILALFNCLAFIPKFGAHGAALSVLITEAFYCSVCYLKCEKILDHPRLWKLLIIPTISSAITIALLLIVDNYLMISLILSPIVFFALLWAMKYYKLRDLKFIITVHMLSAHWSDFRGPAESDFTYSK